MTLWTVVRFLFGNAGAIREVVRNRAALWTAIVLVLLTGVARNYDQTFFLETPMWLIGSLLFSFFSGSFLYAILVRGFARSHFAEENRNEKRWATFMALFWMTAPVAWLYAIPVERFLDTYRAAEANIALLGIVSLWRVVLMSRIMSVLFEIHFVRALGWVLVAAAVEVVVVVFFGSSGGLSRHILAAMAGMRNAPEENLISSVLAYVWGWSWAVLIVGVIIGLRYFRETIPPLPKLMPGKAPWIQLAMVAGVWAIIAIGPQREQHRFVSHAAFIEKEDYLEALGYLEKHRQSDFPPSRRLEPNPYEYRVWHDLPPTIALLKSNTTPWIRRVYLNHLSVTLSHHYTQYDSLTNVAAMLLAVEHLPEGREWMRTNENTLAQQGVGLRYRKLDSMETAELIARTNILDTLSRLGMAQTNLDRLIQ